MSFKTHKRKGSIDIRPVSESDISSYKEFGEILLKDHPNEEPIKVSIADADRQAGSPKIGDVIGKNPNNPQDQWLINEQYYLANYEVSDEVASKKPTEGNE